MVQLLLIIMGNVLSEGWNEITDVLRDGCSWHAEMIAIQRCKFINLKKCILVVIQLRDGNLVNSMPCDWCRRIIVREKIPKVYYS